MIEDNLQNLNLSPDSQAHLRAFISQVKPGTLNFIAARPACGKTSFSVNLAAKYAIEGRQPTCYISLEYGSEVITKLLASALSCMPVSKIDKGNLSGQDFTHLLEGVGRLHDAPFYLIDSRHYHIEKLAEDIHRLKVEQKIEVVFIDYLGLIAPDLSGKDRYSQFITRLRLIAEAEHIAIVGLLQIKRHRGPGLEAHVASQLSCLGFDRHPTLFVVKTTNEEGKNAVQPHLRLFNSALPVIRPEEMTESFNPKRRSKKEIDSPLP